MWNVGKAVARPFIPDSMQTSHMSNIFCLAPNAPGSHVFSSGNDQRLLMHCVETGKRLHVTSTFTPIYGLAIDPNTVESPIVYLASHERRILRFDSRTGRLQELPIKSKGQHHSVYLHPLEPHNLLLSSASQGAALFDLRHPRKCLFRFRCGFGRQRSNYSTFDRLGQRVLVLRPRLPPALFDTFDGRLIAQLDSPGYFNSSTIKSACFAGAEDEWVATGSDDYGVYLWKTPDARTHRMCEATVKSSFPYKPETLNEIREDLHLRYEWPSKPTNLYINHADRVLRGHRSIVNQVRYNDSYSILASCGVEKIVKLWSPFDWTDNQSELPPPDTQCNVYTHEMDEPDLTHAPDSVALQSHVKHFASRLSRSEQKSLQEDSEMILFFRLLVSRDIDGAAGLENFSSSDSSSDEDPDDEKIRGQIQPFGSVGALMTSVACSLMAYVKAAKSCDKLQHSTAPVSNPQPLVDCVAPPHSDSDSSDGEPTPTTSVQQYPIMLSRNFEKQFVKLSRADCDGQSDNETPAGWTPQRWSERRKEQRRRQMMVRIKRLKAIRVELMSLLRSIRVRVEKLICDAEKRLQTMLTTASGVKNREDPLPHYVSVKLLKGSEWENDLKSLYSPLLWGQRHVNSWIRLSRQLQQLREMRSLRTSLLLPDEPAADSFEVFIPMVGHMLRLLLASAFDGSPSAYQRIDWNTLHLNHLRDLKRSIWYLWRECWTRAQCRQLMFMGALDHSSDSDNDDASSHGLPEYSSASSNNNSDSHMSTTSGDDSSADSCEMLDEEAMSVVNIVFGARYMFEDDSE